MDLSCDDCQAQCCKHIALEIDKPTTKKDWDNIFWYLHHENVIIFIDHDNDWLIEFKTSCKNILPNNKCGIYDNRPLVCRTHSQKNCEHHNSEKAFKREFTSVEDLKEYLEEKMIKYQYGEFKK
jgi:uncharacterized protein